MAERKIQGFTLAEAVVICPECHVSFAKEVLVDTPPVTPDDVIEADLHRVFPDAILRSALLALCPSCKHCGWTGTFQGKNLNPALVGKEPAIEPTKKYAVAVKCARAKNEHPLDIAFLALNGLWCAREAHEPDQLWLELAAIQHSKGMPLNSPRPDEDGMTHLMMAEIWRQSGQYDKAIAEYEKSLADPTILPQVVQHQIGLAKRAVSSVTALPLHIVKQLYEVVDSAEEVSPAAAIVAAKLAELRPAPEIPKQDSTPDPSVTMLSAMASLLSAQAEIVEEEKQIVAQAKQQAAPSAPAKQVPATTAQTFTPKNSKETPITPIPPAPGIAVAAKSSETARITVDGTSKPSLPPSIKSAMAAVKKITAPAAQTAPAPQTAATPQTVPQTTAPAAVPPATIKVTAPGVSVTAATTSSIRATEVPAPVTASVAPAKPIVVENGNKKITVQVASGKPKPTASRAVQPVNKAADTSTVAATAPQATAPVTKQAAPIAAPIAAEKSIDEIIAQATAVKKGQQEDDSALGPMGASLKKTKSQHSLTARRGLEAHAVSQDGWVSDYGTKPVAEPESEETAISTPVIGPNPNARPQSSSNPYAAVSGPNMAENPYADAVKAPVAVGNTVPNAAQSLAEIETESSSEETAQPGGALPDFDIDDPFGELTRKNKRAAAPPPVANDDDEDDQTQSKDHSSAIARVESYLSFSRAVHTRSWMKR